MATDEGLFRAKIEDPSLPNTFRLYKWLPATVSIGKHQVLDSEVDVKAAKELGVDVVRRITGGGAVFHDSLGEITYSIIASDKDFEKYSDEQLVISLLKGLESGFEKLGLRTTYDKIHCPSLFVNGKKISGNAQARHKDIILQHGTILVDYRPEVMYTVLKARPDKPRQKMIESVYAYVTTLKNELQVDLDHNSIAHSIEQGFKEAFKVSSWLKGEFTEKEKSLIDFYLEKRFNSEQWLAGTLEL